MNYDIRNDLMPVGIFTVNGLTGKVTQGMDLSIPAKVQINSTTVDFSPPNKFGFFHFGFVAGTGHPIKVEQQRPEMRGDQRSERFVLERLDQDRSVASGHGQPLDLDECLQAMEKLAPAMPAGNSRRCSGSRRPSTASRF